MAGVPGGLITNEVHVVDSNLAGDEFFQDWPSSESARGRVGEIDAIEEQRECRTLSATNEGT